MPQDLQSLKPESKTALPTSGGQASLHDVEHASENRVNDHLERNDSVAIEPSEDAAERYLEVDSITDSDSAYAESVGSDLTSLKSSIHREIWENGRRYNGYGQPYAFPNDEAESERLDMQHAMQGHLLNDRLFWAPIPANCQKVLDIGTGTGIWAIDFADQFPAAEVTGTDISDIQPSWVPPNCKFEIDDAEDTWTWKPGTFDYIHSRNLICCIRDFEKLMAQAYVATKPGGWFEFQLKHPYFMSDDGTITEQSFLLQWSKNIFEAAAKFGTPITDAQLLKARMEKAGFVDIQEHILKIPCGPWPKDPRLKRVGLFEMVNMTEGIAGLSLKLFTRILGWTPDQVQAFIAEIRREAKNRKIHGYYHYYVVFGRKPEF